MTADPRKPARLALSVVLIFGGLLSAEASPQGNRCTDEAASLRRAEAQLPRLDVARVSRRYSDANAATELQPHAHLVVAHFMTEWADG